MNFNLDRRVMLSSLAFMTMVQAAEGFVILSGIAAGIAAAAKAVIAFFLMLKAAFASVSAALGGAVVSCMASCMLGGIDPVQCASMCSTI